MSYVDHGGRTIIDRLRVTGAGLDPFLTRLRAAHLLGAVGVRPASLPPAAILCVHALPDPLPGMIPLDGQRVIPPPAWQEALRAAVSRLAEQAARPAHGPVPAGAGAVLFADYAEMLACLALDWCEGQLHSRWWWQVRAREVGQPRGVVQTWLDAPEHAPAALQLLAERGAVERFARSLHADEPLLMARTIAGRFAAPDLARVLAACPAALSEDHHQGLTSPSFDGPTGRPGSAWPSPARVPAPWRRFVPEAAATSLTAAQRCLIGVGLMLRRAPVLARQARFAQAVGHWLVAHTETGAAAVPPAPSTPGLPDAIDPARDRSTGHSSMAPADPDRRQPTGRRPSRPAPHQPRDPGQGPAKRVALIEPPRAAGGLPIGLLDSPPGLGPDPSVLPTGPTVEELLLDDPQSALMDALQAEVKTALGGLFYLINLGLYLGLYGDFTAPEQPGIALSIWDFVALLGEKLVGGSIHSDPVWGVLASLAGRSPGAQPGADYRPPADFRMPPGWLPIFPEPGPWRWDAGGGRLRVKHPTGFWVLDIRSRGNPERQLAREMRRYAGTVGDLRPASLRRARSRGETDYWVGLIASYCRARLRRALAARSASAAIRQLCVQQARVMVTASTLSVIFRLGDLLVEVRQAGLDRDPGWVPAAGRFVAFIFE